MKNKETRIANVGSLKVPINDVVRDARGHEEEILEIMESDFVEGRYSNFGGWIHLLPDAADVAELDRALWIDASRSTLSPRRCAPIVNLAPAN